jgi:2-C-methyl-D-erythritol 2,4-cyclodiphosphate synthase
MRIGLGYDIHAFARDTDRVLVLGGVIFPGEPGLAGHSDADVVLHAISDALLGAHALGDIGDHFPPGDPAWLNADSRALLRAVCQLLPARVNIGNVDVTVIAERPRIAARRDDMRAAIAAVLEIGRERVSVKATTNETLGALGRGEGVAALAVVLTEDAA